MAQKQNKSQINVDNKDELDALPINSSLRHPKIAREVGFLVIYSANFEMWLLEIFKKLQTRDSAIADVVFSTVDNLRPKIDIVYGILEAKRGWHISHRLLPTKDKVISAIAFRNALCHGLHGIDKQGRPNLTSNFLVKTRGKPKTITLSPEKIRSHVDDLRSTIGIIREIVGADLFLAHPGPIDGVLPTSPQKPFQANSLNRRLRKARQVQRNHTPPESSHE